MSPVLIATLCGLVAAFCWGVGDWLQARTSKAIGPVETYFAVNFVGLIMVVLVLPFTGLEIPAGHQLVTLVEGAFLIAAAYLTFIRALAKGLVGIVVPLGNIYPLFTLVLSIIFLHRVFAGLQVAAMFGIVLGAALLAYEKNRQKAPLKELHLDTFLALSASFLWGYGFYIINPLFETVEWQVIFLANTAAMLVLAIAAFLVTQKSNTLQAAKKSLRSKAVLIAGVILNLGAMVFYAGADYADDIVIISVLASSAPLVASLVAAVVDKEKIGALKRAGAVVIVAGIIVLNIT